MRLREMAFALVVFTVAGCGDDARGPRASVTNAVLVPSEANHLAATITFETSAAVVPAVQVIGPDRSWPVPASGFQGGSSPVSSHEVTILGLEAELAYRFRIGGDRVVAHESLAYTPGPMPAGFPAIEVTVSQPDRMAAGFTVVGLNRFIGGTAWIVVVDAQGDPVWYHRFEGGLAGVLPLSNGNFAGVSTSWAHFDEIGPLGERVRSVVAADLNTDTVHHEVAEGPDGHILVLSSELLREVPYPDGQVLDIVADILLEVDGHGAVVGEWHLADILDLYRILPDARLPFWNARYPDAEALRDWCHINSLVYRPERDSFVMSGLNQRILFEMSRSSGELLWVLGEDDPNSTGDDDWPWLRFTGEGRLPARQHGIAVNEAGNVMVYDNAFDTQVSRGVEYEIDLESRVARQVFAWSDPEIPVFSPVGGDHDPLSNGNVLLTDPVVLSRGFQERVVEVDRPTGDKVFEIFFLGSGGFNAHRIASLYP